MPRIFSLYLAFGLTLQGTAFAQTVQRVAGSGNGVPTVPTGTGLFGVGSGALSGLALPRISLDGALIQPAAPAAMPAAAVSASAQAALEVESKTPVLDRLATEVPFGAPQPSDLQGQRDFADKSFEFKLGGAPGESVAAAATAVGGGGTFAGSAGSGDSGGGSSGGDGGRGGSPGNVVFAGKSYPSVAFRPDTPIEVLLISAIDSAKKNIRLALTDLKLRAVLDALRNARNRGVDVQVILDYASVFPQPQPAGGAPARQSREVWTLLSEGFNVSVLRLGKRHSAMNHNFAVVDDQFAELGPYEWSFAAESNHHAYALFSAEPALVQALLGRWTQLRQAAQRPAAAKDYAWPTALPAPNSGTLPKVSFNGVDLPSVAFAPGRLEEDLLKAIAASRKSIDISQLALRSTRVVQALAEARGRGVRVRVILDERKTETKLFKPFALWLAAQGVKVLTVSGPDPDGDYPLAQKNKSLFAAFDGKLVQTGTPAYTKNAFIASLEDVQFLQGASVVKAFEAHFKRLLALAEALPPPKDAPDLPTDQELVAESEAPWSPPPKPQKPEPGERPRPRDVPFKGRIFPSFAFRPLDPVADKLVEGIDAVEKSLLVAIYQFNLDGMLEALRRAKARGVDVKIVLDHSHVYTSGKEQSGSPRKPSPQILALINEGFDVLVMKPEKGGIQHNKFIVFDGEMVEFGSYNYTITSEKNHEEDVYFSIEAPRVAYYQKYFYYLRGLSTPVDREKLDKVLTRSAAEAQAEEAAGAAELSALAKGEPPERLRESKFPPPPEDPERPIRLYDESFPRQLFSPEGQIEETLLRAIRAAKKSIEIAMFGFYSWPIAKALKEAKDRGIQVRLVLDENQSKTAGSQVDDWFAFHGFDVKILAGPNAPDDPDYDPTHEKMHHKFMIIDGENAGVVEDAALLIAGSFNLSKRADKLNGENENFISNPVDIIGTRFEFERMYKLGWRPRRPRTEPQPPPGALPDAGGSG